MYSTYAVPPQGYRYYDYTTSATTSPSSSPSPDGPVYYYNIPQQYKIPVTPPRNATKHNRSASHNTYTVPGGWHFSPGYRTSSYHARQQDFTSPSTNHQDFVSTHGHARRYSTSTNRNGGNGGNYHVSWTTSGNTVPRRHASTQSQKQPIIYDSSDEAEYSQPQVIHIKPRTGSAQAKYAKLKANQQFCSRQVPVQVKATNAEKTQTRRTSTSRPSTARPKAKTAPSKREATAADAAKHKIPAGYSLKNWDPTEAPVMLLGSVFDANSLGKWIYDWTVFRHGPAQPMSDVAGDLWLLLIKLAGKMKRADECLPRLRDYEDQDTIEDFLDGGDRLWARFKTLLKICEEYMWKAAKREGKKGAVTMGKNSGCEFIDSIFGRERKLKETEGLMASIRLWIVRFDENCEDIIRNP